MSVTPVIDSVEVLPTLSASICVIPPTDLVAIGGSILTYKLTITNVAESTSEEFADLDFANDGSRFHYLQRVGDLQRGVIYSASVIAVGPSGETAASAGSEFECICYCSRAEVIRQRMAEIVDDANLLFLGEDVRVHMDWFGRSATLLENKIKADGGPVVAFGVGYDPAEDDHTSGSSAKDISIPVRIAVAADHPDEADWTVAIADNIKVALNTDWELSFFGVGNQAWRWTSQPPRFLEDSKICVLDMAVALTMIYDRETRIW